jgi:prolyl-tRNA editing enzyme YbaK/EbsC (Cys-tRNA(Pro) deacylase)
MSLESVRAFLAEKAPDIAIIELEASSATVMLAAEGHGVTPAQIAKTLSLRVGERNFVVVTRGDARLDKKPGPLSVARPACSAPKKSSPLPDILSAASPSGWQPPACLLRHLAESL